MYTKTRSITHPLGVAFTTPLLVPSFSSKGFLLTRGKDGTEHSEAADLLDAARGMLTDSMLVSAFDLHYGYLPPVEHAVTEITILDSGGYETSEGQDLSSVRVELANPRPWTSEMYRTVIEAWPVHVPAIMVSFDSADLRHSVAEQIVSARELFAPLRGNQMTALLLKPERAGQRFLELGSIAVNARELRAFDVIGVTEKELGDSILGRMVALARLRETLDANDVSAPIHVFGSLDPISVPLYFLSGAEIFDGLTWLRYGYHNGAALYRADFAARNNLIDRRDDLVKMMAIQSNLSSITTLGNQMRRFLNDRDYSKFGPNADLIRDAEDLLATRMRKRG